MKKNNMKKKKDVSSIDLTLNPKKAIKRADLALVGEMFIKASKDARVGIFKLTLTDDAVGTPNSMMFPILVVDK